MVPQLCCRQANRFLLRVGLTSAEGRLKRNKVGYMRLKFSANRRLPVQFFNWLVSAPQFGCYMVKPHGQLVSVSSTPHNAYTPDLSTW